MADVDRPGWEHRVAQLWDRVTDEVLRLGGTPAGEHGDGRLRAGLVERLYGPELMGLLRKVKAVFDPGGVFNPGVVLPDQWRPLEQLKVGDRRVDLPQDIERGLREMERSAGWGRPRLTLADGS